MAERIISPMGYTAICVVLIILTILTVRIMSTTQMAVYPIGEMMRSAIGPMGYTAICVVLIILTILTVSVSFIPLPGIGHIVIGLLIGTCKATLVVLFFMHALYSSKV